VRNSRGNKVEKHISIKLSQHGKFGSASFNNIFEDFYILGVENKKSLYIDEHG